MLNARELRYALGQRLPELWRDATALAEKWCGPIVDNLDRLSGKATAFPKTFTDPVLGPIELYEWEVAILDSPLLQRLRGVRQLGMAHAVYSGATHDRLSHTLGVVEVADRMIRALERNAENRRKYGADQDEAIPPVDERDRCAIRLAALLHDIGHAPFSHASEPLVARGNYEAFEHLYEMLRENDMFPGAEHIQTSEAVAVLIILSEPMQRVLEHRRFAAPFAPKEQLPTAIAARLLGSRRDLYASYLGGLISGPIDADKLDYLARDSYFTGLPLGLDVSRLISKLEVVTITPDQARDDLLRARAEAARGQRLYELGISAAAVTAYEQMIIGRVLMYDRVYFHHKVRCAEAMVRQLFRLAEGERNRRFSMQELYVNASDDSMVLFLAGDMRHFDGGQEKARQLGERIRTRHFYHRAFAFDERFISGLESLSDDEQRETKSGLWQDVMIAFRNPDLPEALARQIHQFAAAMKATIRSLSEDQLCDEEEVLVDWATDRFSVPKDGPPVRSESGMLTYANLFFRPDRWTEAYKTQKKCSFVFAPRASIRLICLAAQIVFYENFGLRMSADADRVCKTDSAFRANRNQLLGEAFASGLCSPDCHLALTSERPTLLRLKADALRLPKRWVEEEPNLPVRLADEFFFAYSGGVVASVLNAVIDGIEHLCWVIDAIEKDGEFVAKDRPDEKHRLQPEILKRLRARQCDAREGTELAGGESDIILPGDLVVENKVAGETSDLGALKPDAAWQARRYSIPLNRRISFVIVAYKPATDAQLIPMPSRLSIHAVDGSPEKAVYIRLILPWGHGTPSTASS